jgi:prepilin-type processing-associated H-X9-DG protein
MLYNCKYLDNLDVAVCPSLVPYKYTLNVPGYTDGYGKYMVYGVDKTTGLWKTGEDAAGLMTQYVNGQEARNFRNLLTIPDPSRQVLVVDSVAGVPANPVQYFVAWTDPSVGSCGAHLRHQEQADGLLADGHAEACNSGKMKKFGFNRGYTGTFNFIPF